MALDRSWEVRPEPALAGFAVEWAEPERLLVSRRNRLYRTQAPGGRLSLLAEFPAPRWKASLARLRPAQRALRFLFYNVLALGDGTLFTSFDRSLGRLVDGRFLPIEGLARPFRVLRSACALGDDGCVYLGEYFDNSEREAVHVYRYVPGAGRLEVAYRFPPGAVRHVHGIYHDPQTGWLWCLTGDRGDECRICRTGDGFTTLETVGQGDESFRSVSAQFTERAIYYATDAEFRTNVLYRIDRISGERTALAELDGPVYYSAAVGGELFFGVTAELCPSQIGRSATLWHVSDATPPTRVVSFEKDAWPRRSFQFGILHFSRGPGQDGGFFLHGLALAGADNRTFFVRPRAAE